MAVVSRKLIFCIWCAEAVLRVVEVSKAGLQMMDHEQGILQHGMRKYYVDLTVSSGDFVYASGQMAQGARPFFLNLQRYRESLSVHTCGRYNTCEIRDFSGCKQRVERMRYTDPKT